jgi:NAD(P)-dependent dehydrogenase (short-subunit alcohol dehydrogenase family)
MSSALRVIALANRASYVAPKHGVVGITRSAALEYSSRGIRVNAVGPGVIETPLTSARRDDFAAVHRSDGSARRGEVAEVVAFLLSDARAFRTGG